MSHFFPVLYRHVQTEKWIYLRVNTQTRVDTPECKDTGDRPVLFKGLFLRSRNALAE